MSLASSEHSQSRYLLAGIFVLGKTVHTPRCHNEDPGHSLKTFFSLYGIALKETFGSHFNYIVVKFRSGVRVRLTFRA